MISRTHRFHGHNSLRFVYANGRTVRSSLMAMRAVANPRRKAYRCAVVVSKKVSKSAVVRNRIRRRIYEQIRLHSQMVPADTDLVVTIYSDQVATIDRQSLQQAVFDLLQQTAKNLDR